MRQDGERNREIRETSLKLGHENSFSTLDKKSVRIRAYSDASFGSNPDGSSQLGFILLLLDKTGKFAILKYRSAKFRGEVSSAIAGRHWRPSVVH